ncbi:hypothetical protein, partial [Salmonella enterica]|uniref:hypothetical protein n=1 Tax=Salmonella enterica TaxID=28901 RepID=UPI0020C45D78
EKLAKEETKPANAAAYEAQIVKTKAKLETIKHPLEKKRMVYLGGALLAVIMCLVFSNSSAKKNAEGWGAMSYPQLVLGMIAILAYV